MLEKFRAFMKRIGAKMGMIKDIGNIFTHKKLQIDEEIYNRIAKNKSIYSGYVKEWHNLTYKNSLGKIMDRKMVTMGMGKVVAQEMATLIFNEKCKIDVATREIEEREENKIDPAKEFIEKTLKDNHFYRDFQRYLEYAYALGGMAIKTYYHNGKIKLSYATADMFYPLSYDSENIDEALFVTEEKKDDKYYTLLEWNEWEGDIYVVTNELYESNTKEKLGYKVPLGVLYPNLKGRVEIKGLRRPNFVYFKLNTANNKALTSPLGISLYENSYETLRMLDYLYDYFYNEFKLGKRRIAVDYSMLKPHITEDGKEVTVFDSDETVFKGVNIEGSGIQDLSVGLRTAEIIQGINLMLDTLSMQMGFSAGTFTFDGQSLMTATQVISVNSKTYKTKNSHETLVEDGIKDLIISILDMANLYGLFDGDRDVDVTVDFDDSIAEDRQSNYTFYASATADKLIPKKEAIMRIFKVTEEQAQKWIEEIRADDQAEAMVGIEESLDLIGIGATNQTLES